jgi:hypothetical protein
MFHDYEVTVTVGPGGRVEVVVPEAAPGSKVRVSVREANDAEWLARLAAGTLRGPSLPDDVLSRESIYAADTL